MTKSHRKTVPEYTRVIFFIFFATNSIWKFIIFLTNGEVLLLILQRILKIFVRKTVKIIE